MGVATSVNQLQRTGVSIKLDSDSHLYAPGDMVSGRVSLNQLHHPVGVISIDLIGEVAYTLTKSSGNGAASITHYCLPFFKVSKTSIEDGEKFELSLDHNLPPSVNLSKGVYPYIRYLLQVSLSKTNNHRHWIIVCPRVIIPRSTIHPVYFDTSNHREMRLAGSINVEWVLPGEKFQIEFQINNLNHEHIKYMNGSVIMRAKFNGGEYGEKIMNINIDNVQDTSDRQIIGSIPLALPFNYLPPTFNYTNDTHTFHVTIEYWVVLEVHIKGALHTLKTDVPLMVGFDPEAMTFSEVSIADQRHSSSGRLRIRSAFRKHY